MNEKNEKDINKQIDELQIPDFLKNRQNKDGYKPKIVLGPTERIKKFKTKVRFNKDANVDDVLQAMTDDRISLKDAKQYQQEGVFVYRSPQTEEQIKDITAKYGNVAIIETEEVPPTPEELAEDAVSSKVPEVVQSYFEQHKDELKGKDGDDGDDGDDGKDAPRWPGILALIIASIALLIAILSVTVWHPQPAVTELKDIEAAGVERVKAVDAASENGVSKINAAIEEGIKKIKEQQSVSGTPGEKAEGKKAEQGTQTPAPSGNFVPGYVPEVKPGG